MNWLKQLKSVISRETNQAYSPFGIQMEPTMLQAPLSTKMQLSPVTNERRDLYLTQAPYQKTRQTL